MRPLEITAFVLGAIPLAVAIVMIVRGLGDLAGRPSSDPDLRAG